ncbi:uncharacterized protein B0H18DRAFT_198884 [Fomitopsis serialis]|uniref:uncharacterized protein n=1 Tax=Fomitopsis serialis TaxID=139415 RepID=UPI002007517E|nr:uncharacterized protein B0H18DRAFT_198884 [Neoantrodia serialis]KAH9937461.1 hypothetical protein B0H18DRAFT_198884 [Neoantrodia serialis]
MSVRKRPPPSEPLLPLRAPKHRRLADRHVNESENSVVRMEGASGYIQSGLDLMKRVEMAVRTFLQEHTVDASTLPSGPHSESSVARPAASLPPRRPSRPAIPSEFKSGARPQNTSSFIQATSSIPRKVSQRAPKVPPAEVQIPPTTSSTNCVQPAIPPRSRRQSEPNVSARAKVLEPPAQPTQRASARPQAAPTPQIPPHAGPANHVNSRKKYIRRDHIFEKKHKAKVKETREKDMEEMAKKIFEVKRRDGFTGDYASYKSLLHYQARLDRLQNRNEGPLAALSASASLTDLRPTSLEEDAITEDFLQRALDKANASLASRVPVKFDVESPTHQRICAEQRALSDTITRFLRGQWLPASLPAPDDALVDDLLSRRGVVSKCAREQVSDKDLARLRPGQWLNDEIINFYGQLIMTRAEASKENPGMNAQRRCLNVHYFSSFFWSKLEKDGYEKARLAKWTKKFDIFSKDMVLVPVNHRNVHWTAAAINFRRKRIESYDSMGMPREEVFKLLRGYLDAEHRNKKKKPFDFTGWKDYVLDETPQQGNGYDCGVFTCQFLENLSRGRERFLFRQHDVPYLRRRMIWEIGNAKLREDAP